MNDEPNSMQGSALVESTVLLVVLVPIVFGMTMIGKLLDVKQTSEQASRYAAWEATVGGTGDRSSGMPSAIRERFFGDADNALSSQLTEAGSNRWWGEQIDYPDGSLAARTAISIDESTVTAVPYTQGVGESSVAIQVGEAAGRAGEVLDGLRGNTWGLTNNGLVRAGVSVEVKANEWLVPQENGCSNVGNVACLSSSSVILVDGWSAAGDEQARRRTRSLVPASALQPLGDAVSNVGNLPMMGELKSLNNAFGHVDMTVLPEYAQ